MKFYVRMKALSDETRLRLLNLLIFHEFNVNELVALMQMGQSRISRHLKILSDAGFVISRRDGLWVFYRATKKDVGGDLILRLFPFFRKEKIMIEDERKADEFLRNQRVRTKRHFDRLAEHWEEIRKELFGILDLDKMFDELEEMETVADLGCGTGTLIPILRKKSKKVIGVDQSEGMLGKAREKFPKDVDFRLGQLEHLPLANQETDLVLMSMVLHYMTDPCLGFREVARVLRPNGYFILIDFKKHRNESLRESYGDRWLGFDEKMLEEWLVESGFYLYRKEETLLPSGLTAFIWTIVRK